MPKRKLEELNLLDDFLFGSLVSYPKLGEDFVRILLRTVLQRPIGQLKVIPQKVYYGSDTDKHGTRLDVYLEDVLVTEQTDPNVCAEQSINVSQKPATVYDVEPDQKDAKETVGTLPRRVRFYRAKIDSKSLESGQNYDQLNDVVIIMIMPYDPFHLKRMVYTIRTGCQEEPEMPYNDGAVTIFLYTKGKNGNPPEDLRQLLRFLEHTNYENAVNDDLKQILTMVNRVKQDEEVSLQFMKIYERETMLLNQGRIEGRSEGRAEGRSEGRAEGIRILIELLLDAKYSHEDILNQLEQRYQLPYEDAQKYLDSVLK